MEVLQLVSFHRPLGENLYLQLILPVYQHLRQTAVAKEQQISFKLDRLTFNGIIDLVGDDWVLDYKSDRSI